MIACVVCDTHYVCDDPELPPGCPFCGPLCESCVCSCERHHLGKMTIDRPEAPGVGRSIVVDVTVLITGEQWHVCSPKPGRSWKDSADHVDLTAEECEQIMREVHDWASAVHLSSLSEIPNPNP